MLNFTSPQPTRSGESVLKIWNELKENWKVYKRARLEDDYTKMQEIAILIVKLQEDLGIKKAEFPELKEEKVGIQ